jgi:FKBP-type peptidyl-prolyl cis-trans isomerase
MKTISALALTILLLALLPGCGGQGADEEVTELTTFQEKAGYAIGQDVAANLGRTGVALDPDALVQGLRDGMAGKESLLSDEELQEVMQEFNKERQIAMATRRDEEGAQNYKDGIAFLTLNRTNEGVVQTESGLQYQVIVQGDGPKPGPDDRVSCHYVGTLIDGTEFDSSYKRGQPAVFQVGGVIPGWTEALQMMPVGSKWKLFIPPELAYGESGAGQVIGPQSTLIFEVELLGIEE